MDESSFESYENLAECKSRVLCSVRFLLLGSWLESELKFVFFYCHTRLRVTLPVQRHTLLEERGSTHLFMLLTECVWGVLCIHICIRQLWKFKRRCILLCLYKRSIIMKRMMTVMTRHLSSRSFSISDFFYHFHFSPCVSFSHTATFSTDLNTLKGFQRFNSRASFFFYGQIMLNSRAYQWQKLGLSLRLRASIRTVFQTEFILSMNVLLSILFPLFRTDYNHIHSHNHIDIHDYQYFSTRTSDLNSASSPGWQFNHSKMSTDKISFFFFFFFGSLY